MFTPEDLTSPSWSIRNRDRFEQQAEKIMVTAASAVRDFTLDYALRHYAMPLPMQMQGIWQNNVMQESSRLDIEPTLLTQLQQMLLSDPLPADMYSSALATLEESKVSGYSYSDTAKELREAMSLDSGTMQLTAGLKLFGMNWRARIKRDARTIGTRFGGWVTQQGIWILGIEHKRWVTRRDDAVRETHVAVDGMTIRTNELFPVGGYSLEYPGDSSGPPEEIINCRCVITAVLRP